MKKESDVKKIFVILLAYKDMDEVMKCFVGERVEVEKISDTELIVSLRGNSRPWPANAIKWEK